MDRILGTSTRILLLCGLGLFLALSDPFPVYGESLPDPTKPPRPGTGGESAPQGKQRREPSWELSSIIHSPRRKLAVINGAIRRVGETVAGAEVLSIQPNTVIILYRGQRRVLRLLSQESGLKRTGNEQGANRQ